MAIQAPEGTKDLLPDEELFWLDFQRCAREVFGAYGYLPIVSARQPMLFPRKCSPRSRAKI